MTDKIMFVSFLFLAGVVSFFVIKNNGFPPFIKEEDLYEGFDNFDFTSFGSKIAKKSNDELLLGKGTSFPVKPEIELSNTEYKDDWFYFPHTSNSNKGGSFDQITNNFKYQRNPDIGNALPGELKSIFYQNNVDTKGNTICPLEPVKDDPDKVRVGFFNTNIDVLY